MSINNNPNIANNHSNLAAISLCVNPFVSTMKSQLINRKMKEIPENIKNTGYGELSAASIMNGAIMTVKATPQKFIDVAIGTILGGITSGTYSHTDGPIVAP
jgi:hypothetical protein